MVCFIIVAALLATAPATGNPGFGIATLAFTYLYSTCPLGTQSAGFTVRS
jgi:hypothetical protein